MSNFVETNFPTKIITNKTHKEKTNNNEETEKQRVTKKLKEEIANGNGNGNDNRNFIEKKKDDKDEKEKGKGNSQEKQVKNEIEINYGKLKKKEMVTHNQTEDKKEIEIEKKTKTKNEKETETGTKTQTVKELRQKNSEQRLYFLSSSQNYKTFVRGLMNLGNTCFLNSIMQCISSVEEFVEFLLRVNSRKNEGFLTSSVREFYIEFYQPNPNNKKSGKNFYVPKIFYNNFVQVFTSFKLVEQHDSHEFLRLLLDQISVEETLRYNNVFGEKEKEKKPKYLGTEKKFPNVQNNKRKSKNGNGNGSGNENKNIVEKTKDDQDEKENENENVNDNENKDENENENENKKRNQKKKSMLFWKTNLKKKNVSFGMPKLTIVDELFRGTTSSKIICSNCNQTSIKYEHFYDLSLALPENRKLALKIRQGRSRNRGERKNVGRSRSAHYPRGTFYQKKRQEAMKKKAMKNKSLQKKLLNSQKKKQKQKQKQKQKKKKKGKEKENKVGNDNSSNGDDNSSSASFGSKNHENKKKKKKKKIKRVFSMIIHPTHWKKKKKILSKQNSCPDLQLKQKKSQVLNGVNIPNELNGSNGSFESNLSNLSNLSYDSTLNIENENSNSKIKSKNSNTNSNSTTNSKIKLTNLTKFKKNNKKKKRKKKETNLEKLKELNEKSQNQKRWKNVKSFQYLLFAALNDHIRLEKLQSNNKYVCPVCTKNKFGKQKNEKKKKKKTVKTVATKQVSFEELPTILVINFKRFVQTGWGALRKNHEFASFPLSFDFSQFLRNKNNDQNENQNKNKNENGNEKHIYTLFAISVHSGSLDSGHYIAYIKKQNNYWYYCSDTIIRRVPINHVKQCQAYVLFYRKKKI
ncbi:carboxyl-terminal hydrolase [Anaeramoeba flamelloides]|uniref:Ubiquitin carboxyl-terminal hydrolase n=1 Tax=Anaeramoeba flamelloides TaxID=1746091 RepID=A0AAV7Z8Y1_9EUKA|nr:carboxyl-terminal hydrolase [Anaeramoeba flamelloides]